MGKLYATKDDKSEFYAQIEITTDIWDFFGRLTYRLFDDNYMIDDNYQGELKDNNYFSFEKDGIKLMIIMANKRAHIIILGLPNNDEIRYFIFENYSY